MQVQILPVFLLNNIMKLQFTERDFKSFSDFEKAVKRQLGDTTYVGTEHLVVKWEYPKVLKEMLRPYPKEFQSEFEL
jgi:hypothetical protein